jgi:hypothetical protein
LIFSADASERDNPRSSHTSALVMWRGPFSDFTCFPPLQTLEYPFQPNARGRDVPLARISALFFEAVLQVKDAVNLG